MEDVFEFHYRSLVYYATRKTGDESKAEEFGSTALQKAWAKHESYESPEHLKNSLYTIVRNLCISLLRRRKIEEQRISKLMQLQSGDFDVNKAVDMEKVRAEILNWVWQEIDRQFDKRSADMLRLHFKDGLPDAEIAKVHQTTVGNVQKLRSRTLDKLRKLFGKNLFLLIILFLTNEL
jgi:RNA polymerase sigma-70 factor (ECF subfamily)